VRGWGNQGIFLKGGEGVEELEEGGEGDGGEDN